MRNTLFFIIFACWLSACGNHSQLPTAQVEYPVLPVLTKKATNPVTKIELIRGEAGEEYALREVVLNLNGTTDLSDIEEVGLYPSDEKGFLDPAQPFATERTIAPEVRISLDQPVQADTLTLWVSLRLKEKVDLTHRYQAACAGIQTNKGWLQLPEGEPVGLRAGVAVRQQGQDGVHTSRIPGLTTSKKGTLLAIFDARRESSRDLQGDIDICLHRSFDGGQTWQPIQTVLDQGEWGGMPEKYNGVSDANILVDERTGDIYVAGLWMYGVLDGETGKWVPGLTQDSTRWIHQWRAKGSQPGFGVKETSQFLIAKSTDDGATWSEPINITRQTKRQAWWLFAPAPGHGITLRDGTLVFPTQGRDEKGGAFSNITWSKDGGKSWTTSEPAYTDVTECMAVELTDGSVMLNMRDNRNRGNKEVNGRRICVTKDLGKTWIEHPTSRKALIEPTCMGSIHRHTYRIDGQERSVLLFVNPEAYATRDHITLKVSYDDGDSWPEERKILLDEYSGRGYSCITSVDEQTIGILYESSQADMVFQQVKLNELLPLVLDETEQ